MDGSLGHDPGSIDDELSDDLRARVKSELAPGERLLWAARPIVVPPRTSPWFVVFCVLTLALLLVSVTCLAAYASDNRPVNGPRGDIPPLVGVGLGAFVLAAFIAVLLAATAKMRRLEWVRKSGTLYALTDRRAIIWVPELWVGAVKVYTVTRGSLEGVHRLEFPDGRGDVVFRLKGHDHQGPEVEPWGPRGFEGVADVRRVEEQVRRTLFLPPAGFTDSDDRAK